MAVLVFQSICACRRASTAIFSGPGLSPRLRHHGFSEPIPSLGSVIWHYSLHGFISPGDSSSILYPVSSLQAEVWAK